MPADYETTARALSLSPRLSPPHTPYSSSSSPAPPWIRPRNSTSGSPGAIRLGQPPLRSSDNSSGFHSEPMTLFERAMALFEQARQQALTTYRMALRRFLALDPLQRVMVAVGGVVALCFALVMLVYWHRIIAGLIPVVKKWRDVRGGWVVMWFIVFMTSFPPIIGYSTASTVAGFVTIFSGYVHRLVGQDPRFVALGQVLRRDGLLMLTMIRFCPLPFSLSNGFLATIPTITPTAFVISTALSTPKLLVHVWLASKLALLAENGDSMSFGEKLVNYLSMGIAGVIGITVTVLIYRRTMSRAAEIVRSGNAGEEYIEDIEQGLIENEQTNVLADEDALSLWGADDEEDAYRDRAYDEIMGKPGGLLS
ncbi:Golgi apparatus membrane protein tvp38 [Ceratocystis platani]|uniref:Golgi apparatus membrane protein tvp38 n=1 Tax=Ceratocystis fimbriata f. sp. platani TaxID=88771 RepID=A0A0F8B2V7_CERFI|nr:Golgi apparatus membrane protein tvp38 [Ceratocystis platani]